MCRVHRLRRGESSACRPSAGPGSVGRCRPHRPRGRARCLPQAPRSRPAVAGIAGALGRRRTGGRRTASGTPGPGDVPGRQRVLTHLPGIVPGPKSFLRLKLILRFGHVLRRRIDRRGAGRVLVTAALNREARYAWTMLPIGRDPVASVSGPGSERSGQRVRIRARIRSKRKWSPPRRTGRSGGDRLLESSLQGRRHASVQHRVSRSAAVRRAGRSASGPPERSRVPRVSSGSGTTVYQLQVPRRSRRRIPAETSTRR